MGDLVNRIALRDALYDADAVTMQGVKIINQFPAVNAAPVVRCRDCKRWEPHCNGKAGICEKRKGVARADDFCSYGERKDGDGNG